MNRDPKIHGILVQLPLPPNFDNGRVLEIISAEKDADGFHLYNLGGMVSGWRGVPPCTPYGVMALLDYTGSRSKGVTLVGSAAANIVGKPVA